MTKNDIAKLCFKLLAVYFVMQLFYQFENIGNYLLYKSVMDEHEKTKFLLVILPSILFFFFGMFLWFIAPNLANSVFRPELDDKKITATVDNFHSVAFSIAGLFLFTTSFSEIVEYIVYNIQVASSTGESPLTSSIIIAIIKIVLGVWLILGSKGIVNAIRSLRRTENF